MSVTERLFAIPNPESTHPCKHEAVSLGLRCSDTPKHPSMRLRVRCPVALKKHDKQ